MISNIINDKLLDMEKKIAVFIGSLQAAVAILLALLQLYRILSENWKIKGKIEIFSASSCSLAGDVGRYVAAT